MSTALMSPASLGDLIKREFDPDYSRETVLLKARAAYPLGAVLGRVTATGVYSLSPATAAAGLEGAEIACAVLLQPVPASDGNPQAAAQAPVLARGPVILADRALVFDASVAEAGKSRKHQQLAACGLVVRAAA